MNKIVLLILFLLVFSGAYSQSLTDCSYTYFINKKKSTSQCWDDKKREGKALAYNQKGEVIGEWKLSRMHMLSSVQFTFHENGGVKSANYNSHPDAGIQHYESTTTYDEKGNKTDFHEKNFDGHDFIPSTKDKDLIDQKRKAEKLNREADSLMKLANERKNSDSSVVDHEKKDSIKQEVVQCAVIYVSELWIDNRSGKEITVKYEKKYKGDEKENTPAFLKVKKGEKVKITEQIQAQYYEDPMNSVSVTVWDKKGKKKLQDKLVKTPLLDESRLKENRKGFVYEVR